MEAAAQGDVRAIRLVEKEYGVGNGQDFAIDQLFEYLTNKKEPKTLEEEPSFNKEIRMIIQKQPSLEKVEFDDLPELLLQKYDKEYKMVEEKEPSLEKVEFDKSPKLLTEEEVRKKKEREELEEYFRSRGL